jgi:hypothetical protein
MWLDILEPHLAGHPVVVVKGHPGEHEELARWPILAEHLAGRAEVIPFATAHKRMPLEAFSGLLGSFALVTSAFARVSLKYMSGIDIPNPLTDERIRAYFPKWFHPHITKIAQDQDAYIAALRRWSGRGMLYRGERPR